MFEKARAESRGAGTYLGTKTKYHTNQLNHKYISDVHFITHMENSETSHCQK